ncbi:MAG: transcriptional regulator [Pseudomonadota bacterium]
MPRGDQISRQWQILRILEARRMGVTVPDLAKELDSQVRTIYRDMEALELAGFPFSTDKEDGVERWFFVEGHRLKIPIPLSLTELMALSIASDHLKAFEGTVFSEALKAVFEKIRSMLNPEAHAFLDGLAKSFRVGLTGKKDYKKHRETIDVINNAVLEHRTAVIRYQSGKGEAIERKIDPYHVWFMGGTIYIVAYCHERKQQRLFVLDRIAKAKTTDDRFEIPSDFNMDDFTKDRFRVMGGEEVEVKIRFSPKVAYYVKERTWHPTQKIADEKDGSIVLSMHVEGLTEVKSWVMSFGSFAEALEPALLRKDVASEHKAAAGKY